MAYFEQSDLVLQAFFTRRGLELLHRNNERLLISKFALGDDEINYNLVDKGDPDATLIQSLLVADASTNENTALKSKLIRKLKDTTEILARESSYKFVPSTERSVQTHIVGTQVFSLDNWINDACTVSFAIYEPDTQAYFLSGAFLVDASSFFVDYGIEFDFTPINPSSVIGGESNKYWFNAGGNKYTREDGSEAVVVLGIDNNHKPTTGVSVENITNDLNIPILTFQLRLRERQLRSIFTRMLADGVSKIERDILIYNDDLTIKPVTDFYGPDRAYRSIATKVPITITL